MHDRPKARTEQLISERIDDELVIYDQLSHVAHCLSCEAVRVWEHCDGRLTEPEIAARLTVSLEVVERTVAALEERGLLDDGPAVAPGYSRRQAVVRLARIGGAVVAGPLVYSIDVASAAAAASHLAAGCPVTACASITCPGSTANGTNSACASGRCYCSTLTSGGATQNQFRCAISSSCLVDNQACTSNGACCGNNCPTAAPRRCRPAAC